ncbi:MAG: aminomethyl-transferring glycine dehydrogenase subunit GcvPB [Leptospiraceae bacterium]|nr:aminomethyl-transferring glycine dehydrogenase subunit GcvPB [Leptospiraceae bacterium]MDW7974954.1 aminomethyl-transferring glycine dehydrogenase subunit GcvPB [Leptospiraceae bacterium]
MNQIISIPFKQARVAQTFEEPLIFELSYSGKIGFTIDNRDLESIELEIPKKYLRDELNLPEVSEPEVLRHYTRLSTWNYGIDLNFYPLGSCTMKYNPRINEEIANKEYFLHLHPSLDEKYIQPLLKLIYELQNYIKTLTDMDDVSLQPAAGAHGELAGIFLIRAYHKSKNNNHKNLVLIPDSAHGTNPATCTFAGFEVKELKSTKEGTIDIQQLKSVMNENVAALMITNPNTLGIFETNIREVSDILHEHDALLYMDGANYNAIIGKVSFSQMGIDVAHLNLHKTFSTPHGGGGPGAGAIVVSSRLKDFLPGPVVRYDSQKDYYYFDFPEKSIGRLKAGIGHTSMMIRALVYILSWGNQIHKIAEHSVLNANLIRSELESHLKLASPNPTMHEVVFSHHTLKKHGYETVHLAKTLIDYGFHPPTVYFPLIVPGAIMIEPTETESPETILKFTQAVKDILRRMENQDQEIFKSPLTSFVNRVDEVGIAKNLILKYFTK